MGLPVARGGSTRPRGTMKGPKTLPSRPGTTLETPTVGKKWGDPLLSTVTHVDTIFIATTKDQSAATGRLQGRKDGQKDRPCLKGFPKTKMWLLNLPDRSSHPNRPAP